MVGNKKTEEEWVKQKESHQEIKSWSSSKVNYPGVGSRIAAQRIKRRIAEKMEQQLQAQVCNYFSDSVCVQD